MTSGKLNFKLKRETVLKEESDEARKINSIEMVQYVNNGHFACKCTEPKKVQTYLNHY